MFDNNAYQEFMDKLKKFSNMSESKQEKFLWKLFTDEEFIQWMHCPKSGAVQVTPTMVTEIYTLLTKAKVLKALISMIEDRGTNRFGRTQASMFFTMATVATDVNNTRATSLAASRKSGEISNKDAKELQEKIEAYGVLISDLLKLARKIVKHQAKELSKATNLDKAICIDAYWTVPDPKYIDKFKVGRYSNTLMDAIYTTVASGLISDPSLIRWKPFIKEIFGKENVDEVATFILLEGVHRIDKFSGEEYRRVRNCWDVLTNWALKELNDTSDDIRNQMVELYIKRIDKMFRNRSHDLRVNLTTLDGVFPNLAKTVEKYAQKITDILEGDKKKENIKLANNRPPRVVHDDDDDD